MTKEEAFEEWLYTNRNEVVTDWDLVKQSSFWALFERGWEAGFCQGTATVKKVKNVKE
jgi:hypothetical protein